MHCFTWINDLWKRLFCGNTGETSISRLPNDIMFDILRRLPAQSVLACKQVHPLWLHLSSTSYFAEIHLKSVTPILLGQERLTFEGCRSNDMFIFEGFGKNTKVTKVGLKGLEMMHDVCLQLYDSCNGFLLFGVKTIDIYVIYNPLTLETFRFFEKEHRICGFFFHEQERDYKLLLCSTRHYDGEFCYYLYSLSTIDKRMLRSSPYCPLRYYSHYEVGVLANGALFWIVKCLTDSVFSHECSKSIMMFDLTTEDFHVMPHPGLSCTHSFYDWIVQMHEQMRLLEVDGKLTSVNLCEKSIEVWVLEDVAKWMWLKRFVVDIGRSFADFAVYNTHPVVAMQSDELLVNWPKKGFFCCNLLHNSFRKLRVSARVYEQCDFYVTKFRPSFVSNVFSDSLKSSRHGLL